MNNSPISIVGLKIQQRDKSDANNNPTNVYQLKLMNDKLEFSLMLDAVVKRPQDAKYIYAYLLAFNLARPMPPVLIGQSIVPPLTGEEKQVVSLEFPFKVAKQDFGFVGDDPMSVMVQLVWSNMFEHQGGPDFLADVFFRTELEVIHNND